MAQPLNEWRVFKSHVKPFEMAEDGENLWINTSDDLVRFNKETGSKHIFNNHNAHPLCRHVLHIAVSNEGELWCTTPYGLLTFDGQEWDVLDTSNTALPTLDLNRIAIDKNDRLWISTYYNDLIAMDNGNVVKVYNYTNSLLTGFVTGLEVDNENALWVGSKKGLFKLDNGNWQYWNYMNSDLNGSVEGLAVNGRHVWIRNGYGLEYFDGNHFVLYSKDSIPGAYIWGMDASSDGSIWYDCQSCTGGLMNFNRDRIDRFWVMNSTSFLQNAIMGVLVDGKNQVWCASEYGRLYNFDGQSWKEYFLGGDSTYINRVNGIYFLTDDKPVMLHQSLRPFDSVGLKFEALGFLSNNLAWKDRYYYHGIGKIAIDGMDNIWTKEWDAIKRYNYSTGITETIWEYDFPSGLGPCCTNLNHLAVNRSGTLIAYDRYGYSDYGPNGQLWFMEGLGIISEGNVESFNAKNSNFREGNGIYDIEVDTHDKVWIATPGEGVWVYHNGMFQNYNTNNSQLETNHVYELCFATDNSLWAGHYMGFSHFDGSSWTRFYLPDSSNVESLEVDIDGSLWLLGDFGVIYHYDFNNFSVYNEFNSPLPIDKNDGVKKISIDLYGNKWFSTSSGLYVYRKGGPILPEKHLCTQVLPGEVSFTPNPASTFTHISFNTETKDRYTVRVVGLKGSHLSTVYDGLLDEGDHCIDVDLSNVSRGVYVIAVMKDGVVYATGKVVKM